MSAARAGGSRVVVLAGPGDRARARAAALAQPADPVIDRLALERTMTPSATTAATVVPDHVRHLAHGAFTAALERARRLREPVTVWVVHPDATDEQLTAYRRRGFDVLRVRAQATR